MNINNYNNVREFLEAFRQERNLSQKALGEALGFREGSYINQIESGKKAASSKFLKKFCEVFTEFQYEDCQRLLDRDKGQEKNEDTATTSLDINSKAMVERVITDNPLILEFLSGISQNPEQLEILQATLSNPHLRTIIKNLAPHPEEIQADITEQVGNILESTLSNLIPKYTHKELKDLLLKRTNNWILQSEKPGYDVRADEVEELSIEGHLHLSNNALFFTLEATEKYLSITTCYQDRANIEEFIKLVPGWVHRESSSGSLGRIYKNVPLQIVRIFNISSLALSVKSLLTSMGVTSRNLDIECNSINAYFRS